MQASHIPGVVLGTSCSNLEIESKLLSFKYLSISNSQSKCQNEKFYQMKCGVNI